MTRDVVQVSSRVILTHDGELGFTPQLAEIKTLPDDEDTMYLVVIDPAYRVEWDPNGEWSCDREEFITLDEQQARKDHWTETGEGPEPEGLLDADTCWAIGLDPTGRDGDPRHPFTIFDLTDEERSKIA